MGSIRSIKRRFIVIIWGISLLFIINLLYLSGLYKEIVDDTSRIMILSIEEADAGELQSRLSAISSSPDSAHIAISIEKSIVKEEAGSMEAGGGAIADIVVFSQLMKELRQTVHHAIDTIMPPDLSLLDSLIVAGFRDKGVSTRLYNSEIVDMNAGAVRASSVASTAGKSGDSYLYEYDAENGYAYEVYTEPMTRAVLERMSGILITTLLMAILLGYAFWYFIRTVVRQKTLEEMKQDFTNNMTHELKTPISVAYSAVDALLNFRQGESREKRRQYLNICIEQLSCLRDSVENILSMSMEQNIILNKSDTELGPLFVRVVNRQKMKTGKNVDVDILVRPESLAVCADATHLYNIIGNLVDNAIKYSSSDHVEIHIKACMENGCSIISVRDNGVGISRENIKHVFDKFYRVPQGNLYNVKGYGLGLFYVKTMVELHGGEVSVESSLHNGSEFIIKIPAK
ncbi:MAG: HAMP domain-containing histidine kinase [Tannerellaceae bacterium]|nr:HAMP domain-containing histidine kinase [Tannerellaceae bacterium]